MSKAVNQKELFSGDHTVYWPDKYETVVEYLKNGTGSSENSNSLYKLNVHVIVLAACVGLLAGEKLSIPEKEKKKEIPISVFNNHDLSIFLYLIPLLSQTDPDVNILKNIDGENKAVKIFEDYAAAGLQILSNKYTEGFVDTPLLFVLDLIRNGIDGNVHSKASNDLPPEENIKLF